MACQPSPHDLRRTGIVNRGGAQAVETQNGFVVGIIDRKKCFRAAELVAFAGITAQEFIQRFFAAIERFPIIFLGDRFFAPSDHDYGRRGSALAAARSLAFGAGGFSSKSRTRKLSLSERCT